jgi:acetyl esterase
MEMRVYRPTTSGVRPALLYITGGAYFTCNLDERDFVCANLARSGFCVFSVKYRTLEDQAVYPAAMVDAYAALLWLAEGSHAGELLTPSPFSMLPLSPPTALL